ncbi:MAG TPA: hypothetical protein VIJ49_09305 [Aestuariivirga sp.]
MGASTRLTRHRHQASIACMLGLVAFSISSQYVRANVGSTNQEVSTKVAAHLPATIALSVVAAGDEKLELSGRLTQNATNYADSVDWILKSSDGQTLFAGASQILSLPLKPGNYDVTAHYGNVAFSENITLPADTSVSVNFDLNAGALRIAPHLTDEGATLQPAITRIYALDGVDVGQLVASSVTPGEIIKLAAGNYRVETRFPQGNVEASTNVEVKAGIMRAVDLAVHGSVVEFPVLSEGKNWTLSNESGEKLALPPGVSEVALRPGAYFAETKLGSRIIAKSFVVQDGISQRLSLQ